MTAAYVHGYQAAEGARLQDQAETLVELLHGDTRYPEGARVLEAGCGVGAQTITLARNSQGAQFISVDISAASLAAAAHATHAAGIGNVAFIEADIANLPFEAASFDHIFVCFVLEHLPQPAAALQTLSRLLRPGGTVTVIEGDHGSAYFHPHSNAAQKVIDSQVALQAQAGGDVLIGRKLYPLLAEAGLRSVRVSPRLVYVDANRPDLADGFVRRTFTAMMQGIRDPAIAGGLLDRKTFDTGIADLLRTAEPDGMFTYTFFKAVGVRADDC